MLALLLYVPVCLISFKLLFPRLSHASRRIAGAFLVAQILVVALSLAIRPDSDFERWLWQLDHARNIPSTLASTQLAQIGVIALMAAWLARGRSIWLRLYLLGLGLIFPYFALDDFFDWQLLDQIAIKEPYIVLGAAILLATIAGLFSSDRQARLWHFCLLAGLFLTAIGGILLDSMPNYCGAFLVLQISDCIEFPILEEILEFAGNWLTLLALLGHFSDIAPAARSRVRLILYTMPFIIGLLFSWNALLPQMFDPLLYMPDSFQSESSVPQELALRETQAIDEAQLVLGEEAKPTNLPGHFEKQPQSSRGFAISNEKLILAFLFALYMPVGIVAYRRLIPYLAKPYAGLASAILSAQIIVITLAVALRPRSKFETWLWSLNQEWNIPSTLASAQLALVAGAALLTAWHAKAGASLQRIYLAGAGLLFLFLAWDEYVAFHEQITDWQIYYAALGLALSLATALVARRSPRRARKWYFCLLAGLAISAIGGILLNGMKPICDNLGRLQIYGCIWPYNYEESLEFFGIWLVLIAVLGFLCCAMPMPKPRVYRALYALPAIWILLLAHSSFMPQFELRFSAIPAAVQFESGISLNGYRIDKEDGAYVIRLYPSAKRRDIQGIGYSVHFIDQAQGKSIASRDRHASRQDGLLSAPGVTHVYRQRIKVELPPRTPVNRAYWIALSVWEKTDDDYPRRTVLASDLQLLGETQVVLGELVLPADSTAASSTSQSAPLAEFDNGFALAAVDMPARAQAGHSLSLTFTWRSDVDSGEDLMQFLHLRHAESGQWFVYDQQPLGPRLPTRLWYSRLVDSETWQAPLPAELAPGQYTVFTGLYRASDQARLPARAADGTAFVDARLPLGIIQIEA